MVRTKPGMGPWEQWLPREKYELLYAPEKVQWVMCRRCEERKAEASINTVPVCKDCAGLLFEDYGWEKDRVVM